jgi:hypothetical protein
VFPSLFLEETMLFKIKEVSDLMVDACLRNEAGELMFLSIYGRDTGLQAVTFHVHAETG